MKFSREHWGKVPRRVKQERQTSVLCDCQTLQQKTHRPGSRARVVEGAVASLDGIAWQTAAGVLALSAHAGYARRTAVVPGWVLTSGFNASLQARGVKEGSVPLFLKE